MNDGPNRRINRRLGRRKRREYAALWGFAGPRRPLFVCGMSVKDGLNSSERDPMVKSRSKISGQPTKKSKKTPARTAGARIREKSRSAKSAARPAPSQTAAKGKWVYTFGGGKAQGRADVRNLLGGKGAGLAEMAHLGLPVPPGFTISTEVCMYFYQNGKTYPKDLKPQVEAALAGVGCITGKEFGDGKNPPLVSVRSGARASMPGMMDTVLNLGLNDVTVAALAEKSGDRRFAYDSYRRFITMYSDVVLGMVHGPAEIEAAITMLGREPGGGLIVPPDGFLSEYRNLIIDLAARYRLPAIYGLLSFAAQGGLAAYGINVPEQFRQAAEYVDRILRGEKAGDLPVQQPTKYELVINLKTAAALGLEVPPSPLATADEVIE